MLLRSNHSSIDDSLSIKDETCGFDCGCCGRRKRYSSELTTGPRASVEKISGGQNKIKQWHI